MRRLASGGAVPGLTGRGCTLAAPVSGRLAAAGRQAPGRWCRTGTGASRPRRLPPRCALLGREISRPKITGTLVQRAESRSSTRPAGCGYRADVHSFPAPARYVSRSRAGAADASVRPAKADNRDRISGLRRYIAGNTPQAIAGVPGPGPGETAGGATRHDVFRPGAARQPNR